LHDTGGYGGTLVSWAKQTNALSLPNTDSYVEAAWPGLEESWKPPQGSRADHDS